MAQAVADLTILDPATAAAFPITFGRMGGNGVSLPIGLRTVPAFFAILAGFF